MEKNSRNHAVELSSVSTPRSGEATGSHQREGQNKRQNKLLPFSIEAILSAPHPKKNRVACARPPRQDPCVTQVGKPDALSTLETFTSATLQDAGAGKVKTKRATMTLEQKLEAIQARLSQRKRRKPRTCFTNRQIIELERRFMYQKYLSPSDRDDIAMALGLPGAQIITWFQNRRAKMRRDVEELKSDVKASSILSSEEVSKLCEDLEI